MTAPNRDAMMDLAPAYALGALDGDDLRQFEAFLAVDAEAQREVAEYRLLAGEIGAATTGPVPPPGLRDRVIRGTPATGTPSTPGLAPRDTPPIPLRREGAVSPPTRLSAMESPSRVSPVWWMAVAASVIVILGLGVQLRQARQELSAAGMQLAYRERELNSILEPGVSLVRLRATDSTSSAGIQLFVDDTKSIARVHAFRLPPAPRGKTYQLWFIETGKPPIPSVTFDAESSGHAMVDLVNVPRGVKLAVAAVTLEPAGGSTTPTMPIVLAGGFPKS